MSTESNHDKPNADRPVILVSTFFPPIAHSATNRIVSFWKYLPDVGHPVSVVTRTSGDRTADTVEFPADRLEDRSLIRLARFDRPQGRTRHKMKAAWNFALATFPRLETRDWRRRAVKRVEELLAIAPDSVVLSSFPPAAPHLVALTVATRRPSTRWIADMRDSMVLAADRNPLRRWLLCRLERRVLARADVVTAVSAPILEGIGDRNPESSATLVEVRNGYDFEVREPPPRVPGPIRILYSGEFYGRRSPAAFLGALDELVRAGEFDVRVSFLGPSRPVDVAPALRDRVFSEARVPNAEAIERMRAADLLLLISPADGERGVYTGKLFEYLAVKRPILGVVPPDDVAAALITECRAGYVAAPDDPAAIAAMLRTACRDVTSGRRFEPDVAVIRRHHRRSQAMVLGRAIDELRNNGSVSE